jgi:hypothetical protein
VAYVQECRLARQTEHKRRPDNADERVLHGVGLQECCAVSYDDRALLMSPMTAWPAISPHGGGGTAINEPYRFLWLKQQLAAFLLIRGPHAFFGTGWGTCMVFVMEWNTLYDLELGFPLQNYTFSEWQGLVHGPCSEIREGVFHRSYSKMNVTLDCNAWEAGGGEGVVMVTPTKH